MEIEDSLQFPSLLDLSKKKKQKRPFSKESLEGNKEKQKNRQKEKEIFSKEFRILNNKAMVCGIGTAYDKKTQKKTEKFA